MIDCELHMVFPTHQAHIRVLDDSIMCFKYTPRQCALEIFDNSDLASDFLFKPMDPIRWEVCLDD
jgi:hypothetical protein